MNSINDKLDQLLRPEPPSTTGELILECYICKTKANVGRPYRIKDWRHDCLQCADLGITVINKYYREEIGRSSYTDFSLKHVHLYFSLSEYSGSTFRWSFDFVRETTEFHRIAVDIERPLVHTFDEIVNITLDNCKQKAKTCLIYC
jgi:hypothetical protein